jgi:hypothetical protein
MIPTRCQVRVANPFYRSAMHRTVVISAIACGLILGSVPAAASGSMTTSATTGTGVSTQSAASTVASSTAVGPVQVRSKSNPKVAKGRQGNVIRVSQVRRLPSGGSFVTVRGRGFDPRVGIYVGLCVQPRRGQRPSPCGGGVNNTGGSAASAWVSSNPPAYARNLAKRYGRNGSFSVRIFVSSRITNTIDCRTTRCAITTRADHTRGNDRTWDLFVPVQFAR